MPSPKHARRKERLPKMFCVCFSWNSFFVYILCNPSTFKPRPNRTDSQVNVSLQNQNLHTDLTGVSHRKLARKFSQVAKSREFYAHTDDLRSTCVGLRWLAQLWKTFVDLIANLSSIQSQCKSTQVITSRHEWWLNKTQVERKLKTYVDLRIALDSAIYTITEFSSNLLWLNSYLASCFYVSSLSCTHLWSLSPSRTFYSACKPVLWETRWIFRYLLSS